VHVAPDLEAASPGKLVGIIFVRARLGQPERAPESGEDRERDPEAGLERLAGIIEREDVVAGADRLADRGIETGALGVESRVSEAIGRAQSHRSAHLVVRLAARRLDLGVGERLVDQDAFVGELLRKAAPSRLGRERGQELALGGADAERGRLPPRPERTQCRILLVGQRQQRIESIGRRGDRERIAERDLIHRRGRLHTHAAQQIELRLIFRLYGAKQRHVALALRDLRLPHVEQRGLAHLIARVRQLQKLGVPHHLLPCHRDLRARLQGREILGLDLRPKVDAGTADVLVGGPAECLLLGWSGEHPAVELPLEAEVVARSDERRGGPHEAAAEIRLAAAGIAHVRAHVHGREQAAVGVPYAPLSGTSVVQGLAIRRAVGPGLLQRLLERQRQDGSGSVSRGRVLSRGGTQGGGRVLGAGEAGAQCDQREDAGPANHDGALVWCERCRVPYGPPVAQVSGCDEASVHHVG
jgi:hypothetical protein